MRQQIWYTGYISRADEEYSNYFDVPFADFDLWPLKGILAKNTKFVESVKHC